jgi:two-component system invasion response regulator UvrY
MKKLLLISNHQITAYGFELLLKATNLNIEVRTVCNGSTALELLSANHFDLIVTILETNAAEIVDKAIKIAPNTRFLAITNNIGMTMVQRLYHSGIKGVVDITNQADIIMQAVEAVLADQTFMEEKFKDYLLKAPQTVSMSKTAFDVLTKREEQVIGLMLKGKKMGEISTSLNLKPSTVSTFKTKIYEKLGVNSVLELQQVCFPQH